MSKYWSIGDPFMKKLKKVSQCRKNLKGGPFGIFQHPFCRKTPKKWKGALWGKTFVQKSLAMPKKNWKGGPFGLVRYPMLRGKPFWFSSLGQRVQFGVFLKFCRTFGVKLFWSLQVYRKKNQKIEGVTLWYNRKNFEKKSQCRKKI